MRHFLILALAATLAAAHGVACGAESTQHFGAGTLDETEVERIHSRVSISELDVAGVA